MGVSVSRSAAEINLDELERRLRGASTEPESADDALIELARRLAPLHSSPHPQAVSEHGRPDTELTTQPLETAKLPPSNSEASNAPSTTAFVEKLARRLALLRPSPYPQAVSEHGRTAELTTQPLETAKLPPSNSEASNAPSTTAFVGVGAKQAFEFDPYLYDPKQGRSGGWKLRVSALALAGLAIVGAVFAPRGGVPSLPKAASFIAEAQGPAKMQSPSDRTVAISSDARATTPNEGMQQAPDKVALSPEQPKSLNAEASEGNLPSVDFGSAIAGAAQPTTSASGGTPMAAPVNTPVTGLPTAAPPPTASQFPDLKTERMLSLRPDGMPIATATPSAAASGEAARANGVSRPRAKPALRAASETAQGGEPSTRKLDLPTRPLREPPARVVAANMDTTAPSSMQATLSQRVQLGAPVNSEKAASALKAPQVAANPQEPLAPAQPVNPLVLAFSDSIGALTARTAAAQKPVDQTATTPSGAWGVQLAAPKSETEAQSDVAQLNAKYASALNGASITVHKAQIYGATFYRVRVLGQSKVDAAALCARLKRDGGDCFIAK